MPNRFPLMIAAVLALLLLAGPAAASDYVPGEVIVGYKDGTTARVQSAVERQAGTGTEEDLPGGSSQLAIHDGESVRETVAELRSDPNVAYAAPNYVARASQFEPNDPYFSRQWNLYGPFGIGMPEAWALAEAAGAPGGRGAVVAVLDSGVAFERFGGFRRAPDLKRSTFVHGWDFVDRDRHPNDRYGHGTHVTGTIAQATNNGIGVAGVAYGVKIMPLRVLNDYGEGDSVAIAKAIRYAARRGADVINLSLEFDRRVVADEIPEILAAVRYAHSRGAVIVAAAGNTGKKYLRRVAYPARASEVIAVGATTRRGCRSEYSSFGADLDVVAPGGGVDAEPATQEELLLCHPERAGSWIYQETFLSGNTVRRFGLPNSYEGTSMASPHVAGIAALIIATGKLGPNPTPNAVQAHIQATARDLGRPGPDSRYGAGLVDAARALRCPPLTPC
ncbi:MAG: serine protease [Thermoleophilaceae bacterium]|jgi:serine protease|nr:serine protease [Thermoleophilaceae bacterium]